MRCQLKNKQKMYYALYQSVTEVTTGDTIVIDGEVVNVENGTRTKSYSDPVPFKGNIAMTGGEVNETEYGIDVSNYSAVLVMNKGEIPIDEHSLIWFQTTPSTPVDESTADYKVVKLVPSLNIDKYLLQRIEK